MTRALAATALVLALAACATPPAGAGKSAPVGPPPPSLPDDSVVCATDVRQCADGSFVSRNPDNGCAFDACPYASKP